MSRREEAEHDGIAHAPHHGLDSVLVAAHVEERGAGRVRAQMSESSLAEADAADAARHLMRPGGDDGDDGCEPEAKTNFWGGDESEEEENAAALGIGGDVDMGGVAAL